MSEHHWLVHAWQALGVAERKGRAHNPRVVAMFRDAGHPNIKSDEVAWCAAFVGAVLERSGIASTQSLMARSYENWGEPLERGRYGAVAVFSRGTNPAHGHVGFWLGETDDSVIVLGGNQSNAVTVAPYSKNRLLSVRWPSQMAPAIDHSQHQRKANTPNFEKALQHVLEMEGGFTDDPHDPGGPTNRGITLGVYAAWKNTKITSATRQTLTRGLKAISLDVVRAIYKRRYWEPAGCTEMPTAVAFMHFDAAVNHGVYGAARMLQKAVGVDVDGKIGPISRRAISRAPPAKLIETYADIRRSRYRALPHFWRFGRGWLRRVDKTLSRARAITTSDGATNVTDTNTLNTTAPSTNSTNNPDGKWWAHSMTIWGTVMTGLAAIVPPLAAFYGVDIGPDLIHQMGKEAAGALQATIALFGTVLTIWGRIRAAEPLARRTVNLRL